MLETSRIQLEEAVSDLSRFESSIELDPARLKSVEDRLDAIYSAARKHRVEPEALPELLDRLSDELEGLSNADERIEALEAEIAGIRKTWDTAAGKLSKTREKAATALSKKVNEQLAQLGMDGARFDVDLVLRDGKDPHPGGLEVIEFLIATNPGQAPRSLNRIASGGELSRISLAIQVVTADTSDVPTMVFDEVDVGIGGAVAEVVGTLLRRLGGKGQIICVTHLAQVAAQGHQHMRVVKQASDDAAHTEISALGESQKVEEIARMLGGAKLTKQTMAHADEMFREAQAS